MPVQENELPRTPSRRINTAVSEVSDQYSSSPCRKMVFNRHLRSGLARPCRACPFNIPRACARKRTLRDSNQQTGIQTDKQTAPNRHLGPKNLKIELLESKVSVRTPNRQFQTDSSKQTTPNRQLPTDSLTRQLQTDMSKVCRRHVGASKISKGALEPKSCQFLIVLSSF